MRLTPTRAFLVPVVVLAVAELLCRLFFADSFSSRFDYGYAPAAGFSVDGDTVRLERSGGRRFYPQSFALKPDPATLRLFTVGDSVTRGETLASAYPQQLAEVLAARGVKAESLNLGVTAYGAARKDIVARQALQYAPGVMLLHVNEANEGFDERDRGKAESYRSWHPSNWPLKSYALHRLYEWRTDRVFWKFLPEEIRSLRSVRTPDAALSAALADPAMLARWHASAAERTAGTVQAVRAAGVPVVLIVVTRNDRENRRLDDFGLDAVARRLAGPGIAVVSCTEVFAPEKPEEIFTDGMHLTEKGHRLLAERLADAVLAVRAPR